MPRGKKDLTKLAAPVPWTYLDFDISRLGRRVNAVPFAR
jgi:hypothetical protein